MGLTEMVISQSMSGLFWAFFSAQPVVIEASTGSFFVITLINWLCLNFLLYLEHESSLHSFCSVEEVS